MLNNYKEKVIETLSQSKSTQPGRACLIYKFFVDETCVEMFLFYLAFKNSYYHINLFLSAYRCLFRTR